MNVLITGATGFIGKKFVHSTYDKFKEIYLLVREPSLKAAQKEFQDYSNIHYIVGDIADNDLLRSIGDLTDLKKKINSIIHLAGKYDLESGYYPSYVANVIGTQNVLYLAKQLDNLEYFHHASTYAVNTSSSGLISEEMLDTKAIFEDSYSKSKMEGELLVREADLGKIKKRIYRPGVVIGRSDDGHIEKLDGPYYFLKFVKSLQQYKEKVNLSPIFPMPFDSKATMPIIPLDMLVEWLTTMILEPTKDELIRCYHLLPEKPVKINTFIAESLKHYNIKPKPIAVKRLKAFEFIFPKLGLPKELLHYMYSTTNYSTKTRKKDYPELKEQSFQDYKLNIYKGIDSFLEKPKEVTR